jgi:3-oxoacyl-[acyl-carrier protein] reductase
MKKTAFITGASGGIGVATARKLASEGYDLILHYHRNKVPLERLKQELPVQCRIVQADLSLPTGPDTLMEQGIAADLLILNSGKSRFGLMTDLNDDEIGKLVQLHITSPYKIAQKAIPSMVRKKSGNIVVITSIWGEIGASCEVLYSMVKGGQNSFVKALAKELAPSGIRVNAVSPGAVKTKMLDEFTEEELDDLKEEIPLGRLGMPEEIADAVSFAASERASYITGQILSVNGGWHV